MMSGQTQQPQPVNQNSNSSGDFNFFPNLPSFDLLRSSCLDLDQCHQGSSSPGSSASGKSASQPATAARGLANLSNN